MAYDYCTGVFLLQWDHFVAELGRPTKVVSDRGSQLTSASNINVLDWDQVEEREGERGTDWEFVSVGHQWRNKLTELRVKAFKVTLKQMLSKTLSGDKPTLSYDELCTILIMAANVINNRPIALRSRTHGNLVPTP